MRRVRSQFLQSAFRPSWVVRGRGPYALLFAIVGAASLVAAPVASADTCANEAIRVQQGPVAENLPDCMALEMVSPVEKGSQPTYRPMISVGGDRVSFQSRGALADTPGLQDPLGTDAYVASRGATGWTVAPTNAPGAFRFGWGMSAGNAKAFTPDLSRWFSLQATPEQAVLGQMAVYEAGLGGDWSARTGVLRATNSVVNRTIYTAGTFLGATQDLSHLFLRPGDSSTGSDPRVTYLPGDPEPQTGAVGSAGNTYVVNRNALGEPLPVALLARDASGKAWGGTCGAWVGGGQVSIIPGGRNQGAVSTDGSLTYFSTRPDQPQPDAEDPASPACAASNPIRILQRVETPSGVQIDQLLPTTPAAGSDYFQGASTDGSKVLFTTTRQLAATDQDSSPADCFVGFALPGCDLYLYDTSPPQGQPNIVQVSGGGTGDPTPGTGANVYSSVTAIAGDGSRVYFVAQGALTTEPNSEGDTAIQGQPNLYVYERDTDHPNGRTSFIGTLSTYFSPGTGGNDSGRLYGSGQSFNGSAQALPLLGRDDAGQEIGGDGRVLVFQSRAALTSDDTDGNYVDVYRYDDIAETLRCVSCTQGPDAGGSFDVYPVSSGFDISLSDFAVKRRWASEDAETISFATEESLLSTDTGSASDSYIWRNGNLTLLPSDFTPPVVSPSGDEVAFRTPRALLPQDGDTAPDIYVARVNGGFPQPVPPTLCDALADACQDGGSDSVPIETKTSSPSGSDNAPADARKRLAVSSLSRKARRRASRTGRVPLKVRASRAGVVRLTARAKVGKKVRRVGRASKRVKAGRAVRVNIRLSPLAKRTLRKGKRLRVTVEVRQPGARTRARNILLPGVRS